MYIRFIADVIKGAYWIWTFDIWSVDQQQHIELAIESQYNPALYQGFKFYILWGWQLWFRPKIEAHL